MVFYKFQVRTPAGAADRPPGTLRPSALRGRVATNVPPRASGPGSRGLGGWWWLGGAVSPSPASPSGKSGFLILAEYSSVLSLAHDQWQSGTLLSPAATIHLLHIIAKATVTEKHVTLSRIRAGTEAERTRFDSRGASGSLWNSIPPRLFRSQRLGAGAKAYVQSRQPSSQAPTTHTANANHESADPPLRRVLASGV